MGVPLNGTGFGRISTFTLPVAFVFGGGVGAGVCCAGGSEGALGVLSLVHDAAATSVRLAKTSIHERAAVNSFMNIQLSPLWRCESGGRMGQERGASSQSATRE